MNYQFPTERLRDVRTPFYFYDLKLLRNTLKAVHEAADYPGFRVHYAVKANVNPVILREICRCGLGADTVSGGEIEAAIAAGFAPDDIVFAGVGKSDEEIEFALRNGISCFNVESEAELEVIEEIAERESLCATVALRVNPNIDAHTHHYITTGLTENKFGIDMALLAPLVHRCLKSRHLNLKGLHFHIGSQITDIQPYRILCERINALVAEYEAQGIVFESINVGGGLGIDYDNPDANPIPDFQAYFDVFKAYLKVKKGQEVHFELGRSVVGQCGSLITKVLYVKEGVSRRFVIVDGGFTDLIRPALYQAHHKIENITSDSDVVETYDVVGPICESSDCFGVDEVLNKTRRGDLIALRSAGAYGEVMASQYNCRRLPGSYFAD